MTQRQEARDAKDRVKELSLDVSVGLTQDEEGSWVVAVRPQQELTAADRDNVNNAAGEVAVSIEKIKAREGAALFIRRGSHIYKRAKTGQSYLLEEMELLHRAAAEKWEQGNALLEESDFEGFLAHLQEAHDWVDKQFGHLIEITEEAAQ